MFAYCYRSGEVRFGSEIPYGAIQIAEGYGDKWETDIEAQCRISHDGKTLLVPGIPEAPTHAAAMDALCRFVERIREITDHSEATCK